MSLTAATPNPAPPAAVSETRQQIENQAYALHRQYRKLANKDVHDPVNAEFRMAVKAFRARGIATESTDPGWWAWHCAEQFVDWGCVTLFHVMDSLQVKFTLLSQILETVDAATPMSSTAATSATSAPAPPQRKRKRELHYEPESESKTNKSQRKSDEHFQQRSTLMNKALKLQTALRKSKSKDILAPENVLIRNGYRAAHTTACCIDREWWLCLLKDGLLLVPMYKDLKRIGLVS